jgi:hypothetical protein
MMQRILAPLVVYGAAFLVAALMVVAAGGFFGAALYFGLCGYFSPPIAALLTGVSGLVLALLVIVAGRMVARGIGRSARRQGAAAPGGLAADLGMLAGERAASLARSHPGGTLAASLAAGFAVGASPNLRRLLRELLEI